MVLIGNALVTISKTSLLFKKSIYPGGITVTPLFSPIAPHFFNIFLNSVLSTKFSNQDTK